MLGLLVAAACTSGTPPDDSGATVPPITVVTYNTGTSEGLPHDADPDDGYTSAHAQISDTWYGDGLAWQPALEAAAAFFDETRPDIVVFQEIFHAERCADIPAEHHAGFVCESWTTGDLTVAQQILGPDYQVACHPGKDDKCAAVRTDFGSWVGCDREFCLEGLQGRGVEGCGQGARVARGQIQRADGGTAVVVNVHGSSGLSDEDQACRTAQVEQVFIDLDGEPGANGATNLVLGDLNTDPGRWADVDPSAARWNDFVGPDRDFRFVTDVGPDAPPSYAGVANIDHVISDVLQGDCLVWGVSPGTEPVYGGTYFDHEPVVCEVE